MTSYWRPGAIQPVEGVLVGEEPESRLILGTHSEIGPPSSQVSLALIGRSPSTRLIVSTSRTVSGDGESILESATFLLDSLSAPFSESPERVRKKIEEAKAADWDEAFFTLDGQSMRGDLHVSTGGQWVAKIHTRQFAYLLAGAFFETSKVSLQRVRDWTPYGVNLEESQTADAFFAHSGGWVS